MRKVLLFLTLFLTTVIFAACVIPPGDDDTIYGEMSVALALAEADESDVTVIGVVTSYPPFHLHPGFWIQDPDGTAVFIFEDFGTDEPGVAIGNKVIVRGTLETYTEHDNNIRRIIDAELLDNDNGSHSIFVFDNVPLLDIALDFHQHVSQRFRVENVHLSAFDGPWICFETGRPDVKLRFHSGSYPVNEDVGYIYDWIEFTARDVYFGDIRGEALVVSPTGHMQDPPGGDDYLDIFLINDLHGMILPQAGHHMGMGRIGNFLINMREESPENTIILAGGDMLQGSALSNYFYGETVIELMNAMYFDAFALGNHEFDWGLDVVTRYFIGGDEHFIADFPLLGANVFEKGTTNIPEGIDPYVIIERGDLKIGIIGTMGYGLESSIAVQHIEDYEFAYPGPIVALHAYDLRVHQGVDIVLLLTHDSGQYGLNGYVADLEGDYRIDAIFNGHSHQVVEQTWNGVPAIQAGGYGSHVGHIRLYLDGGDVIGFTMNNLNAADDVLLQSEHPGIMDMIDVYMLEAEALFEPIIYNPAFVNRGDMSAWAAKVMRMATGADIGFQNYGGTRQNVSEGNITMAVLYAAFPFDNYVATSWISGAEIKQYVFETETIYDSVIDINDFDNHTLYKIATTDFLFLRIGNPFEAGDDPTIHPVMIRDLFAYELSAQSDIYAHFSPYNAILTNYVPVIEPEEDPPESQP